MTFSSPILAIVGLACVAIPILIHIILRRRRRPVRWGAMRFVMEAYRRQRRRLLLEQWLLLLLRCLAVALIAMGVAGATCSREDATARGPTTLFVLIDDGPLASLREADGRTVLERHAQRADEAVRALDGYRGDRAALVALGASALPVVMPPSSEPEAVAREARGLRHAGGQMDLRGGLDLVARAAADEPDAGPIRVFILSDWRTGSARLDEPLPRLADLGRPVEIVTTAPATDPARNIALTDLRPGRRVAVGGGVGPEGLAGVTITARRSGAAADRAEEVGVTLSLVAPGSETTLGRTSLRFEPGDAEGRAVLASSPAGDLRGDASIVATLDDPGATVGATRRAVVRFRRSIRVGVAAPLVVGASRVGVAGFTPADWALAALRPEIDEGARLEIELVEPGAIDPTRLEAFDALVVPDASLIPPEAWRRMRAVTDRGGVVFIAPGPDPQEAQLWTEHAAEALALPLRLSRQSIELPSTGRIEPSTPGAGILGLLRPEIEALAQPVEVLRLLGVEPSGSPEAEAATEVLALRTGEPLLLSTSLDRGGTVVLLTTAIDPRWSTLPVKPLMVALMQETVRQGVGAGDEVIEAIAGERPVLPAGSVELTPLDAFGGPIAVDERRPRSPMRHPGLWSVRAERGGAAGLVAVNADPEAGRSEPREIEAVRSWLQTAGVPVSFVGPEAVEAEARPDADDRRERAGLLSLNLLLGAIALLLSELVLNRRTSFARPGGGA
ncbi:MAG: VWA domain-containing protein [Phycisphaerales bacterium]|nr:MAG: VWA domain-containing protein [Phycisphaerales bacterium]